MAKNVKHRESLTRADIVRRLEKLRNTSGAQMGWEDCCDCIYVDSVVCGTDGACHRSEIDKLIVDIEGLA